MEPTCHRCTEATFVIFEDTPWCRAHFLAEVEQREAPTAQQPTAAGQQPKAPTPAPNSQLV